MSGLSNASDFTSPVDQTEEPRQSGEVALSSRGPKSPINRSASTSSLRAGYSPSSSQLTPNSESSVRVKSNNEETVIEVLINHLSSFYVNDPHAWSKHVLIVRKKDSHEHGLSYDAIPLKVYRTFKSRDGVDFAIRSIEELPSPLRSIKTSRQRENRSKLTDELLVGDLAQDDEKLDAGRKPLPIGLAICTYQSESADELSIKPGQTFKIKENVGLVSLFDDDDEDDDI